jgi:hypothetical protein
MSSKPVHRLAAAICAVIAISYITIVCIVDFRTFPNVDEIAHFPSGLSHWEMNRFDMYRVNPPLIRMLATFPSWFCGDAAYFPLDRVTTDPRIRWEFQIGLSALGRLGLDYREFFWAPRLVCLVIGFSAFLILARFIWQQLGNTATILLFGFWLFNPEMINNAASICPDLGSMSFGVILALVGASYVRHPTKWKAIHFGLWFGLTLATKLIWLTGFLVYPFVCLIVFYLFPRRGRSWWSMSLIDLPCFWITSLLVLNSIYLFSGTGSSLGSFDFQSEVLTGQVHTAGATGNRFADTYLGKVPMPFPKDFLLGIDFLRYEVEQRYWSFLNGEWRFGSWTHYYLMTTLYKTPEPTICAALFGFVYLIIGVYRKCVSVELVSVSLFLAVPALVGFVAASCQGGFNHHHRYVISIYPAIFVFASMVSGQFSHRGDSQDGVRQVPERGFAHASVTFLGVTLMVLSSLSSLSCFPHFNTYFSTWCGGPEKGWKRLGYSNIEWGQDLLYVRDWIDSHTNCRPLLLDLDYLQTNPPLFDQSLGLPPKMPKNGSVHEVRKSISETQWWIISVKKLYNLPECNGLEYLQQIEPVEKIAYSYHVYRIDPLGVDEK